MRALLSTLASLLLLSGCSTRGVRNVPDVAAEKSNVHNTTPNISADKSALSREKLDKLYPYYNKWHLTPYKYGGLSQNGVDCSGFVYRTYRDLFKITLPRSTQLQAKTGKSVPKNALLPGDLLFFKTSHKVRHVGIYLHEGQFMHASTSNGVIISRLDNAYWRSRFWQARRVQ
jgi:cell wall-associated NlpC family hydrolase